MAVLKRKVLSLAVGLPAHPGRAIGGTTHAVVSVIILVGIQGIKVQRIAAQDLSRRELNPETDDRGEAIIGCDIRRPHAIEIVEIRLLGWGQ